MKLIYSPTQIESAAKFIWKKNKFVTSWPDPPGDFNQVYNKIHDELLKYANQAKKKLKKDKEWSFAGSGGYYILMTYEESIDTLDAEVWVDPAVSKDIIYQEIKL